MDVREGSNMGTLQTRNFTIFYNDVPDGVFRAQAIAASCEQDLSRLAQIFRVPLHVDGLNPQGFRVYIISPPSGGASNRGWLGITTSSEMDINGDFAPMTPTIQTPTIREELARFLFVAELAEIFMDVAPGGWDRGASHGEALSHILGTELHPMGYYGAVSAAPRVNFWLRDSSRPDWASAIKDSDTDFDSFTCGILFINYLRHQLGFDLGDIIALRPDLSAVFGGFTLAERFAALTGKSAGQAFPEFMALLEKHLPQSRASETRVVNDNIFPLRDAGERSLFMVTETGLVNSDTVENGSPTRVTIKPGILCGEREYRFWTVHDTNIVSADASCSGFANASFRWSVNGEDLPSTGSWTSKVIPVDITVPNADMTHSVIPGTVVSILYRMDGSVNRGRLQIQNNEHTGTYDLNVRVTATEAFKNDGDSSVERKTDLPTLHFTYDPRLSADQRLCNGSYSDFNSELLKMTEKMRVILNTPDPPDPGMRLGEILEAADRVNARIAALSVEMDVPEQELRRELTRGSRLSQEVEIAQRQAVRFDSQPESVRPYRAAPVETSSKEARAAVEVD